MAEQTHLSEVFLRPQNKEGRVSVYKRLVNIATLISLLGSHACVATSFIASTEVDSTGNNNSPSGEVIPKENEVGEEEITPEAQRPPVPEIKTPSEVIVSEDEVVEAIPESQPATDGSLEPEEVENEDLADETEEAEKEKPVVVETFGPIDDFIRIVDTDKLGMFQKMTHWILTT